MLVPVQYQEYDITLFLMIFPHTSLHCQLVQSNTEIMTLLSF